jgi:hypothetical protein
VGAWAITPACPVVFVRAALAEGNVDIAIVPIEVIIRTITIIAEILEILHEDCI